MTYGNLNSAVDARTTRRCAECKLCCTALEVKDLDPPKAMGEPCKHLCEKGCGIYENRPDTCAIFYCSWRASELLKLGIPENLKPNQCGFVLHWDPIMNPTLMTLFVDPDRPNNWVKYKRQLETIARVQDVAIGIGGGTSCSFVLSPIGNWYAKADHPHFFDGLTIGVPKADYRRNPHKRAGYVEP